MAENVPRKKRRRKNSGRRGKTTKTVANLLEVVTNANLNNKQLVDVVADFLYSLGNSIEGYPKIKNSIEIMERYGTNPTMGNSLMAQAKLMKEAWSQDIDIERINNNEPDLQGKETTE
jgi:hypothetical protein